MFTLSRISRKDNIVGARRASGVGAHQTSTHCSYCPVEREASLRQDDKDKTMQKRNNVICRVDIGKLDNSTSQRPDPNENEGR